MIIFKKAFTLAEILIVLNGLRMETIIFLFIEQLENMGKIILK